MADSAVARVEDEEGTSEEQHKPLLTRPSNGTNQLPSSHRPPPLFSSSELEGLAQVSTTSSPCPDPTPPSDPSPPTGSFRLLLRVLLFVLLPSLLLALLLYLLYPHLPPYSVRFLPPLSYLPSPPSLPSLSTLEPSLWSTPSLHPSPPLPAVCILSWDGRWGNHLYQLMFILSAAAHHHLAVYVPVWPGYPQLNLEACYRQECPQAQPDGSVVHVTVPFQTEWGAWFEHHALNDPTFLDVNPPGAAANASRQGVAVYQGYFQYHAAGYRPYEALLRSHVKLRPALESVLEALWAEVLYAVPDDVLVVGVHLRKGDFRDGPNCVFCRIPTWWYYQWLRRLRANDSSAQRALQHQQLYEDTAMRAQGFTNATRPPPRHRLCDDAATRPTVGGVRLCLLVTSDEVELSVIEFRVRNETAIPARDVVKLMPKEVALQFSELPDFLLDWWLLTKVAMLAVSHSTFSYTAALFNVHGGAGSYWRPDPDTKTVEEFQPWDTRYNHESFAHLPYQQEPPL